MDSLGYLSQLETTTVICFEGSPIVRAITNRIWYLHFLHVSAASPREITALLIYFLSVNHESIPEWIMMSGEKHLEKCTTKRCTAVVTKLSHLAKHKYTNTQIHKYKKTQIQVENAAPPPLSIWQLAGRIIPHSSGISLSANKETISSVPNVFRKALLTTDPLDFLGPFVFSSIPQS